MRCPACRYAGPVPPAVAGELRAVAGVLAAMDARSRQLSAAVEASLKSSRRNKLLAKIGLLMTVVPGVVWAISTLLITLGDGSSPTAALYPLAITVPAFLIGLLVYAGLKKRAERLEDAVAAVPPQAPGEPAACHICGAPLTPHPGAAIARCAHCAADNLVEPAALERARRRRGAELGTFEEALRRQVAAVQNLTGVSTGAFVALGCGLPVVSLVGFLAITVVLFVFVRNEPDLSVEYAATSTPSGWCVGILERDGKRGTVDFQGNAPPGQKKVVEVALTDVTAFQSPWLVGKRVRGAKGPGTVVRATSTPILLDSVDVKTDAGAMEELTIPGLCLVDPPR